MDYGFVGDVVDVDYDAISLLLFKNCVPVVAPITCDMNGQLLNTNADTVASELASALSRIFDVTLTFCFEKEGVLDADGRLIPRIDSASFEALKADGTVRVVCFLSSKMPLRPFVAVFRRSASPPPPHPTPALRLFCSPYLPWLCRQ